MPHKFAIDYKLKTESFSRTFLTTASNKKHAEILTTKLEYPEKLVILKVTQL